MHSIGSNAYFTDDVPLPFSCIGGICFPNQAQFNSRKYCLGLANTLPKNCIFENSKVVDISKDSEDTSNYTTICENGSTIKSKYVVLATHYPIINFPGFYFLKMYQNKSYLVAIKPDESNKLKLDGIFISAEEPVTSLRTANINNQNLVIIGGSGHKTGDTSINICSSYENLENYIKTIYQNSKIIAEWSTEDCITLDKLPYIGEFSSLWPNVYVATGFKKWGMTTSFVAANTILHEIKKEPLEDSKIYKATRFSPIKNGKEMGNMIKQTSYSLVINKLKSPIQTLEDLNVGDGGIISYNGQKIGAYKKSKDEIICVKPYCTHLGCELSWNQLEKTWDCPCHGSRFDYNGVLMNEPSRRNLDKVDI